MGGHRKALESYLLMRADSGRAPWWVQLEELVNRVDGLSSEVAGLKDSLGPDREAIRALEGRLGRTTRELRALAESHGNLEKLVRNTAPEGNEAAVGVGRKPDDPPTGDGLTTTPRPGADEDEAGVDLTPELAELVKAREEAHIAGDTGRSFIDRLRASERLLEIELTLIKDHGEMWPPDETWDRVKRGNEISWRWRSYDYISKLRRRLECRRWLRRLLTLGLWWG